MFKIKKVFFFLFTALFIFSIGCVSVGTKSSSPKDKSTGFFSNPKKDQEPKKIEPAVDPRFADVPVPSDYKLNQVRSIVFETDSLRIGLLTYEGREDVQDLLKFYNEEMSRLGWQLINSIQYQTVTLNFTKEDIATVITISPKGRTLRGGNTITIFYGPKSKGTNTENKGF